MNIIVTGAKGQLGFDVVKELRLRGYTDVYGIDKENLDITDKDAVLDYFKMNKPDVIVHCAAYTAVDYAEDNENLCYRVNVFGTKLLIDEARKYNAKFIFISTDYVFDGTKDQPYEVNDTPNPISVYGRSKYLGEKETLKLKKYFIIRISWVFGINGNNFIKTMLRLSKEKPYLNVVNDQHGSPTYTCDLSRLIADFIETEKYGIYHATNEGSCTWFEFSKEIFRQSQIEIPVYPILTSEYQTRAIRPKNSEMSKLSLDQNGFERLPDWKDALKRYLVEIGVI